jgi:hypothetical protein
MYGIGSMELSVKIVARDGNYKILPLDFSGLYTVGNILSVTQALFIFYKRVMKNC